MATVAVSGNDSTATVNISHIIHGHGFLLGKIRDDAKLPY